MEALLQVQNQNIGSRILQCSYRQITEIIGMTVVMRNKWFITLQKGCSFFLVFKNEETNSLALYDVLQNKLMPKDELFLAYYYLTGMDEYEKALDSVSSANEFVVETSSKMDLVVGLYYGNYTRSRFPEQYQTFAFLTEDPWFKNFTTYNISRKKFSLPLFNNNNYGVANFVDFNETSYQFRHHSTFSLFYPVAPSNAQQPFQLQDPDLMYGNDITDNQLIISFNPLLLFESRELFRKPGRNYYPVLLESNINTLKFIRFVKLIDPLKYNNITILYSKEKEFYYQDLLNTMLFLIHFVNFRQPDFHFDCDYTNENIFHLVLTRYPPDLKVLDVMDLFEDIKRYYMDGFSSQYASEIPDDGTQENVRFITDHAYTFKQLKVGKETYFIMEIQMKVEPVLFFCQWLIKRFLKSIELIPVTASNLFK